VPRATKRRVSEEYVAKLRDPRWQKRRLQIMDRDEYACQTCGDDGTTLHIHHLWYSDGEPWEVPDKALLTLCSTCHEYETETRKQSEWKVTLGLRKLGCLASDFNSISDGIETLAINDPTIDLREVGAAAIGWLLSDPVRVREMVQAYLHSLKRRAGRNSE
jgi:hypothetical protein